MTSEAGFFHEVTHDGQRNFAYIDSAERAAAEAQNFQANAIFAVVFIPIQVSLGFQGTQDVAGGTLWNLEFAADFSIVQAFWLMSDGFQHGQSALNCN